MAKRAARKKKSNKVKVNMKGVEGRVLLPEGEFHAEVHSVELDESDKGQYLSWKFKLNTPDDPKLNGQITRPYITSLQTQALWNLRNLLTTLGVEVPDGPMEIDPAEMVGLSLIIVIEHDTYEGKKQAKVVDFMPGDSESDDEEDDEEVDVDEDEDEEDEDEEEGDEEEDEDEEDEDEEDEDEDDEEEEELEMVTEAEVKEMDLEELADLIKTYDLDVNLKDKKLKTAKKKIAAIVAALEEEGYLADEE